MSLQSLITTLGTKLQKVSACQTYVAYSLYNFYGAVMTIKGRLLLCIPIVKRFRPKIFPDHFLPKFDLWGIKMGLMLTSTFKRLVHIIHLATKKEP